MPEVWQDDAKPRRNREACHLPALWMEIEMTPHRVSAKVRRSMVPVLVVFGAVLSFVVCIVAAAIAAAL